MYRLELVHDLNNEILKSLYLSKKLFDEIKRVKFSDYLRMPMVKKEVHEIFSSHGFRMKQKVHVDSNIFIAHCMESEKVHILKAITSGQDACIAIGPEGDFTQEEVDFALENGAVEISLGESRLRTETAAIVVTTYFRAIQQ